MAGSFDFPAEVAFLANHVRVVVTDADGSVLEEYAGFSEHRCVVNDVAQGMALVSVSVHDIEGIPLFSGSGTVEVAGDETVSPVIDMKPEAPQQPVLSVNMLCDTKYKVSWPSCGLADNWYFQVEYFDSSLNNWYSHEYYDIYADEDLVTYNTETGEYECVISDSTLSPDTLYRVYLRMYYDYNGPDYVYGPYSDYEEFQPTGLQPCNGQVSKFHFSGWLYGHVPGMTSVKLYHAGAGSIPSVPPAGPALNTITFGDTVTPNDIFDFGLLDSGVYWVYANCNLDYMDNWGTAFKRGYGSWSLDSNRTSLVLQLHFNPEMFPNGHTVSGTMTGGVSSENIVELYWYNYSAAEPIIFLGYYYCFKSGAVSIPNFPSLQDLATFDGLPYDGVNDMYYMYLWNDEDIGGSFNTGDRYFYDWYFDQMYYSIGDVTADWSFGTITLDSVWISAGKRPVLKKAVK